MCRNLIETILGAVVLVVTALFLVFAYSNASLRASRATSSSPSSTASTGSMREATCA